MSAEAKRVKILTLVELVLGVVMVVCGIVFLVGGATGAASYALCAEGVATTLFGGRGALMANVPARMGKLATLALACLLVQVALVVCVVVLVGPDNVGDSVAPVALAALPAVVSLAICLLSRGMAKRAER